MAETQDRMSFADFSENLTQIFARILSEGKSVVVEIGEGELVEVKPVPSTESGRDLVSQEDDEAFLSAAGGWADVDIDAFLKDIYESRKSSRPPVEL